MARLKREESTADPPGGFLSTAGIVTLMGILVLFMIGVAWLALQWLPSVQSF